MSLTTPGINTPNYNSTNFTAPSANPNYAAQYSGVPAGDLYHELDYSQGILYREPDGTVWIKYDDGSYQPLSDVFVGGNAPNATETARGILELATETEVKNRDGVDTAVTPYTLTALCDSRTYTTTIGDSMNDTFVLVHGMQSALVFVWIQDIITGSMVAVDYKVIDNVTLEVGPFSFIPGVNSYRVNLYSPFSF